MGLTNCEDSQTRQSFTFSDASVYVILFPSLEGNYLQAVAEIRFEFGDQLVLPI